jgi:hypothetical protein
LTALRVRNSYTPVSVIIHRPNLIINLKIIRHAGKIRPLK